jgi:hypothetical protein
MPTSKEALEKSRMAFTLKMAGMSWAEVAAHDHNGEPLYSEGSAACRAAKAYIEQNDHGDDLLTHRAVDMYRFDALQRAMWRKALGGDLAAAKFCLELIKAREKLLGTQGYQPPETKVDPLDELASRRSAG